MQNSDTIAAIATPMGKGGIGIIRISGPKSRMILEQIFVPASRSFSGFIPWKLHRGHLLDEKRHVLDDALVVLMPAPNTFTGEDVVELHCHGGPALLEGILESVLRFARQARRGEFSRRAFMNGRMDLSQAEAVAELIDAPSREGARLAAVKLEGMLGRRIAELRERLEQLRALVCLAVDFPDDEIEPLPRSVFAENAAELEAAIDRLLAGIERTRCWREGIVVALAGPVNAGKSSLMNALLGRNRAIVTSHPGTTRDFLEETLNLYGLPVRLVDTAGLRENGAVEDPIEAEGIRMGVARVRDADIVLLLVDGEKGMTLEHGTLVSGLEGAKVILIWNKADLVPPPESFLEGTGQWAQIPCDLRLTLCAKSGDGVDTLAKTIRDIALEGMENADPDPDEVAPNARQARNLKAAKTALAELQVDAATGLPYELCAVRLEEAAQALGDVVGLDTSEEVLNRIFETFCIGK